MTCSSAAKNAAQRISAPSRVKSGRGMQLQALQMRTLLGRTVLLCDSTLAVLLTVVVVIAARFMWIYPAAYSALS
jgi:hypothetical protein